MALLREMGIESIEEIKDFFRSVYSEPIWGDDWSDEKQLNAYIRELIGNSNSLTFGLFEESEMVGLCMGSIRHFHSGTEYRIEELCIKSERQGEGLGTHFIRLIEDYIREMGLKAMVLRSEKTIPLYGFFRKNDFLEMENNIFFAKDI